MEKKITKKEILMAMRDFVLDFEAVGEIPSDVVIDFIDKTVEQLDKKAQKSAERAREKRLEEDVLLKKVNAVLSETPMTADEITELLVVENPEITKNKVIPRLTTLINDGIAKKEPSKTENGKKMVYSLCSNEQCEGKQE